MIKEKIASPFCDNNAVLVRKKTSKKFRKEEFEITEHYYQCTGTGAEFTTDEIDQVNLNQVYNQYRDKFGLPFPDQIRRIREKYEISASKMSSILGLGTNSYRLYEQGEVPSVGNGRLILAADDPYEFKKFLRSSQEVIREKDFKKLSKKVDALIEEKDKNRFSTLIIGRLFDVIVPDEFTGYRLPNLEKISYMILFFSERTETWKTKLNKLLFYSDFLAFKHSGYGISGLEYKAIQMGPVPSKFDEMYNEISYGDIVQRDYYQTHSGNYGSRFSPKTNFKRELFEDFEIEIMSKILDEFKDLYPKDVIEKSHKEIAWKENEKERKRISYKNYGFELKEV